MKFRLDGEEFELTQDLVRERVSSDRPEVVRLHWVEVDGDRWPVKQVMALATGLDRHRFQSQNSRRLLAKLGFTVSAGVAYPIPAAGRQSRPRDRTVLDVAQLRKLEQLQVNVALTWRDAGSVLLDTDGLPKFPPLPHDPGLYRFDFGVDASGMRRLYIGESKSLARRASNYRNAKTDRSRQRTSRRIHKEVVEHLMRGGTIAFAIATEARNDTKPMDLRSTAARRLAENAAVFVAQTTAGTRVLNIDNGLEITSDASSDSRAQ